MKHNKRWIAVVIASMVVLLALFGILLWKLGIFNFTDENANVKIIAATIAMLGGLIGSLVTIIGIYLKHSLDQRNTDLKEQAEKRLNLEAAIQAVQLLSTSSGKDVPVTQRAGVLFTLANLGLIDLALNMAVQMLRTDHIDPKTVTSLLNQAIESDDEETQYQSTQIFSDFAEKFLLDEGACCMPRCLDNNWYPYLSTRSRQAAAIGLFVLIAARPNNDWDDGSINALVCRITYLWQNEPDNLIRSGVSLCFEKILRRYPPELSLFPPDGPEIVIDEIKNELSGFISSEDFYPISLYNEISDRLDRWVE